ncbi:MAG: hypothetical protein CL927_06870 [Deltaproteobacteria bacterium]|nr:hypothetical protein [Deltaproteobacteria bacterium]
MKHQTTALPINLEHERPALIRIVGALTLLAVTLQVAAHFGIQAWLNARLFAAATQTPPATQIGPDVWAAEVGAIGRASTINLESMVHAANHYELLAMAIAWTIAGAMSALYLRIDQRPLVASGHRRPAYAIPVLTPAPR